jgi:hypothetical protein
MKIITLVLLLIFVVCPIVSILTPTPTPPAEPKDQPLIVYPTPTPIPTQLPIIIDIGVLTRYDRDKNGALDKHELHVIETDFHYKRLTGAEIACFISIIGYTPVINPLPTPNTIPTPTEEVRNWVTWDTYYDCDCMLPTNMSMQEYLANSDWIDEYESGSWDCSQMSAYMEWSLENCGYNVVIRQAMCEGESHGHAWILVEFEQGWLAYECTARCWVYPSEEVARSYDPYGAVACNPSMYTAGIQYDDIYDVWNYYKQSSGGEEAFLNEYGWWDDY